jgi:hypothetical protein
MTRYHGNQIVDPGIYLNLRELSFKSLDDTGRLPGGEEAVYRQVPALVLLVAAPLIGLVYAIFLPLIGFMMLGTFLAGKLFAVTKQAAEASVPLLRPAWQPARAFLSRAKPAKKAPEKAAAEDEDEDEWAEEARQEAEDEEDEADRS